MPRSRHAHAVPPAVIVPRNRHGHGARGPITGPHLPLLHNRIDDFEMMVAAAADYLTGLWPDELSAVHFEVAAAPAGAVGDEGVRRWSVDRGTRTVVLYRVPIQRLTKLHRNDDFHKRMLVEACVFRAVAELLGRDPWDLAPDRFNHF
ncbi:metallopeptidase family protein [Microbacterium sp. STN6]|uniref:metallopeptidase family protein n=1 Tax=Microbacterium sp. STN6 TaxID=2995588 RepID=UPI002260FAF4|nr:metallopeptidase family protein [Microbacterium sp. STN6]MCX7521071.1 metallopeptidase family protein [Microbacterium sp. STN6]